MKFHRTYSAPGDPYAGHGVRAAHLADRQSRRVGDLRGQGRHGADRLEPGRGRRPRPEVLPQGRGAQGNEPVPEEGVPEWLWRSAADQAGPRGDAARRSVRAGARRAPGLQPAGRLLDVLGLEARLLRFRRRRARLPRRDVRDARAPSRRAELAAVVQHRPALGVRHFRPGARSLVRRSGRRRCARPRPTPTNTRKSRPVTFFRSKTISSTKAGSSTA